VTLFAVASNGIFNALGLSQHYCMLMALSETAVLRELSQFNSAIKYVHIFSQLSLELEFISLWSSTCYRLDGPGIESW